MIPFESSFQFAVGVNAVLIGITRYNYVQYTFDEDIRDVMIEK